MCWEVKRSLPGSTRGRHEPTMPVPSRNLGITRTIVGLGVALAGSGEVPSRGRHNSSVPTRSDGRGVVLAGSGEVPTRGRHDSSVPIRIGEVRSSGTSEIYPGMCDDEEQKNPESLASHVPTARSWGPFLTSDGTSPTIMSLGM